VQASYQPTWPGPVKPASGRFSPAGPAKAEIDLSHLDEFDGWPHTSEEQNRRALTAPPNPSHLFSHPLFSDEHSRRMGATLDKRTSPKRWVGATSGCFTGARLRLCAAPSNGLPTGSLLGEDRARTGQGIGRRHGFLMRQQWSTCCAFCGSLLWPPANSRRSPAAPS